MRFVFLMITFLLLGAPLLSERAYSAVTKVSVPLSSEVQKKAIPAEKACKMPSGGQKGSKHGVCKHCGCRMYYGDKDLEETCTVCKCGKKTKECLIQPNKD